MSIAVVVLTQSDRTADLLPLIDSLASVELDDRILIGNGVICPRFDGWTCIDLDDNIGVPAGRDLGIRETNCDLVLVLDDDAILLSNDIVEIARDGFSQVTRLGVLGLRIVAPSGVTSPARWRPTTHRNDASERFKRAVTFPGGAHILLRDAYLDVGGYCGDFFFKHEETDLSWSLLSAGFDIRFVDDPLVEHPATAESRHPRLLAVSVRNKVWLARRHLPAPLALLSLAASFRMLRSARSLGDLADFGRGLKHGLATTPFERAPMSWSTTIELTQRGRPPIL